jgi:C_GCAxxG_C_C family probable redox protein
LNLNAFVINFIRQKPFEMDPVQKSKELFNSCYGCAESVLMAIAEFKGIQSDLIPRIASGFCGGVANTNGMCGAVNGAIMALNLVFGRNEPIESKELNYEKVKFLIREFERKFGSIQCPVLTGCDLSTETGQQKFNELNVHEKCLGYTGEATRLVLKLI